MPKQLPTDLLVDVALLSLAGATALFFVWRFIRAKKLPSLGVALLVPTGWTLVALIDLGLAKPKPDLFRLLGAFGFVALLTVGLREEIRELRALVEKAKGKSG